MATSSVLTEEQLTLTKPDQGVMMGRGESVDAPRDMERLRMELAPVRAIDPGTKYVEEGNATFISSETDMPIGPAGLGESMGNIELVREIGGQQEIPKYVHGFSVDVEDREVDDSFITEMRDGILTLFDVQADFAFFQGLTREDGTTVFKGVFQWLQDNMPSGNIIDCSQFDPSAGDLQGVPANIIKQKAYQKIEQIYVNETWDIAAAKPEIWADWNQLGTFDGAVITSQWDLVDASNDDVGVGVNRRFVIPHSLGIPTAPSDDGSFTFSIDLPSRVNSGYTSPLADAKDDAMFLIPDHGGDFYELYEQGSPDVRGPLEKEGWKERFEYKWRAGVVQGQNRHKTDVDVARDVVKLENVTALFD